MAPKPKAVAMQRAMIIIVMATLSIVLKLKKMKSMTPKSMIGVITKRSFSEILLNSD